MIAELSAIQAAAGSLKTAGEIVGALISLGIKAEVRAKVIELQGVILAAQSGAMSAQASQMELLQRVRDLEGQLVRLEDWEAEKKRYALVQADSATIYVLRKSEVDAGEVPHAICPRCYERAQKSILQGNSRREGGGQFCPSCDVIYPMWGLPAPP
jgi:hypothetical protein